MRPSLKQNNVPPSLPQRSLLAIALILLWILYLYSTGLYFFSKGFLLTRLRLPNTSSCKVLPSLSPLSDDPTAGQSSGCWYPARYKKALFVVIDALRFDFAVYNSTLEGATDPTADGQFDSPTKIPYYLNRLKTIHSKVKEEPQNALLFQIIADPPTTTLQRLKGITTGSLPTFVEAGNNFGGAAIGEDNIIDQLASLGRRVAFMGDDTWVALFPTSFKESLKFPSESLIVWDLHTVDNEVIEHMFPLLEESNKDEWDVMVAHFLGVDHCGHRFGPNHVTMGDKLSQMDATISRLLDRVDDDTIVIVMGDHGMDSKGDHGGESPQEKEAAMFMYSKKGLVGPSATQMKGKWFRSKETFDESASTGGQGFLEKFLSRIDSEAEWDSFTDQLGGHRTIPQIDVLPTLSLLLGVPIPFNNLGSIIPELFYHPSPPSSGGSQSEIELLLRALQLNARQVHRYMFEYSRTQPSTELAIVNERNLVELFKKAEAAAAKLDEKTPSGARFQVSEDAAAAYMVYLRSSLRTCRQIWAQFDTPLMGLGLVFLLVTNGVALVHLRRVRRRIALASFSDSQGNPECKNPNVRSGMIVLSGGVLGALLSCGFGLRQHFSFSMVDWLILGSASGSVLAYAFGWNEDTNAERKTRPWSRTDLAFGLFLVLPQLFFSASNSTLINEDTITAFLLQSFAVFHLLKAGTARVARTRSRLIIYTLVFLVLTRFNRHLTICREEQFSYCIPTFYASETSSVPSNLSIALISVLGIFGPWFLGKVLKDSESFHAVAVIWINYGLRLMFALSTGYWLLDMEENMEYRNVKMNMARIAAAIVVFFGVPNWWRQPECLKAESAEVSGVTGKRDGGAPASANGSGPEHPKRKVIILGTGNILGAPYLAFMAMIFALLMVVQQPSGILALAAELGQIIAAWEIFDYSRDVDYERKNLELPPSMMVPMLSSNPHTNSHAQRQPPPQPTTHRNITLIQPLILTLIANQAFFATGHQRTLSSIQWNSGFIGLHETSFVISPILVGMNTFGAYILAGCAVPALAFWKLSAQDFFVSSPSLQRAAREQILQAGLMFLLITFGASTTAASFWTANFRRHLMVWKIFAPTWMFLVTSSVVSGLSMITVGLGIGTARTIKVIGGLCGWSSQ